MRICRPYAFIPVFCALAWVLTLVSCEKEVDINLSSGKPKLVVEGVIETDLPPYLTLTRSLGFLSRIDLSTLEHSFVHDAVIRVSDGIQTVRLREYAVDSGFQAGKFYFYSIDTSDPAAFRFRGTVNRTYRLTIEHGGATYTSSTTVPALTPLDSIWSARPPDQVLKKYPRARVVFFRYTDPDTPGNYIRYYTRKNGEPFYPASGTSVYNDELVNGQSIVGQVSPGYPRGTIPFDSLAMLFVGDTLTVKWSSIDRDVYNFWNSYEYASFSTGSPFSSPINLRTNIEGGALGVWAGYGSAYLSIVVRE